MIDNKDEKITSLFWTGKEKKSEKQQLIVGCIGKDESIDKLAARYNSENNEFIMKIKDYMEDCDSSEITVNKMYNEILAGKGPDILSINADEMDFADFEEKGILENLQPYFMKENAVSEKDFVKAVLDSCRVDNKLYILPTNFAIDTIIGKKEVVGEESGWNINQINELMNHNSSIEQIFPYINRVDFLDFCFQYGMNGRGTEFTFNRDQFKEYLLLSEQFPETAEYDGDFSIFSEGKVLAELAIIPDMEAYLLKKIFWNGEIVFKGYPGVEGNGSVLIPINCWGINSKSDKKEAAWEFIQRMFSDEWQKEVLPNWYFSVLESQLKQQLYIEEVDNDLKTPINKYEVDGISIEINMPTNQDVTQIRELIDGTERVRSNNIKLINIINEEVEPYYKKQKSAEEVVDIIEKRLLLYMKE